MNNLSKFCTCGDLACPLHPTNHDKGCAPCISKNLKQGEIPNCFFHQVETAHEGDGYTYRDFAEAVLRREKP
ncbi:MAG: DUF6485 family protein [Clostridiales bacterium]|nr:DUF6485 family protein [Clostridiales bacterium]